MTPSLAASPPPQVTTPPPAPPEPDRIVECGFCHVLGPSSLIPGAGGEYRCTEIEECVQRYLAEGRPRPLLSAAELTAAVPAEALEPLPEPELPPVQEAALAAFEAAHAEDAAETLSEGAAPEAGITPGPPLPDQPANETAEPAPVVAEDAAEDAPEGEVAE